MATFSPSATVQLAINAAREAGLLDAPVRFARPLDDSGTPLQIYLANGRVVLWPQAGAAETVATEPPAPSGLLSADAAPLSDGDPNLGPSPTPSPPPSPKRRKK
ncbi:MAG: hypothetical protein K1X50_01775 [Candidatus Promineofilum sp.]|nr:hypothetical protein [Promineifilum sp.]